MRSQLCAIQQSISSLFQPIQSTSSSTHQEAATHKMVGVGKPRLDKYGKILSRLFENLALFHILKRADGPPLIAAHAPATIQDARRRFLKNLSYICDYRKGGDTTTSMALEQTNQNCVFWIAANSTPNDKVIGFLEEVLEMLKNEPKGTETEQKALGTRLAKKCADFAAPRLKKESKLLHRAVRYCERYLKADTAVAQKPGNLHQIRTWRYD